MCSSPVLLAAGQSAPDFHGGYQREDTKVNGSSYSFQVTQVLTTVVVVLVMVTFFSCLVLVRFMDFFAKGQTKCFRLLASATRLCKPRSIPLQILENLPFGIRFSLFFSNREIREDC